MKRLAFALIALGLIGCNKTHGNGDSDITKEQITGNWVVESRTTDGVADNSFVGQQWTITAASITIGSGVPLAYTLINNTLTSGGTSYAVIKDGDTLILTITESSTVIHLVPATTPPEPPTPQDNLHSPANGATDIQIDTYLTLHFDNVPALGTTGKIRIFRRDGVLIDSIVMEDPQPMLQRNTTTFSSTKLDCIGVPNSVNGNRVRVVNYIPVKVIGKDVVIKPHYGCLEYGKEYYVTVEAGVISGFGGVAKGEWGFKTRTAAPSTAAVTVDDDAPADFRTIQAAIDYASTRTKDTPVTINVKNGTYEELLFIRGKNNLTIKGESRSGVVIRYDNSDSWSSGVGGSESRPAVGAIITQGGGRAVVLAESSDMVRFENLTLENTHGQGSQAETIYFNSGNRLMFVNCTVKSFQDTLNIKGYCWFYNSLIAGDVDFIWGGAVVALFEECEIRALSNAGYIVQARAVAANDKGFVFLNCRLTKETGVADGLFYLARSAGNSTMYDNIAYINCQIDTHIATAGWFGNPTPTPATASAVSGWKEYGSKNMAGGALSVSGRLSPASYQLSVTEYNNEYANRAKIMSAYSGGSTWMSE